MHVVDLQDTDCEVDVCDACGGVWIDWFDGEVRAIATETLRVSTSDLTIAEKADDDARSSAKSNEAEAIGACPRCAKHLVAERYIMTTDVHRDGRPSGAPPSLVAGKPTGAELLRCEDCMGSFVTRASMEVLAFLSKTDESPNSISPMSRARPLPWERFVGVVKAFLGFEEKQKSVPPKAVPPKA